MNEPATGVEARVCEDIAARQRLGIAKYGVTVDQSPDDMLRHAMEEAYDLSVYLRAEWERRQRDESTAIIAATLKALPVGYLPAHTPESIHDRVADLVTRYAESEREMAEAREALEKIEERYINGHDTYADHEFMGETAQQALARIDEKGGNHE